MDNLSIMTFEKLLSPPPPMEKAHNTTLPFIVDL